MRLGYVEARCDPGCHPVLVAQCGHRSGALGLRRPFPAVPVFIRSSVRAIIETHVATLFESDLHHPILSREERQVRGPSATNPVEQACGAGAAGGAAAPRCRLQGARLPTQ